MAQIGISLFGTNRATSRVLKALSLFGGVQIVNIICGLLRNKLISVWVGPAGVGLMAIFNSVIDMIAPATQLNLRQSSVREISQASTARQPLVTGVVRWWGRATAGFGAAVMLMLSPVLSIISFGNLDWWWAFGVLSIAIVCMALISGEQSIMQGCGQLRHLASASVWGAILGVILVVPLIYIYRIESILPIILVNAFALLIMCMAMQSVASEKVNFAQAWTQGREFMKLGFYITIASLACAAAQYAFVSYLNQVTSIQETGIYQAGYTIIGRYISLVFVAIGVEYYPRLSKIVYQRRLASAVISHEMALLVCIIAPIVVVMVSADELVLRLLYSDEFMAALPMIAIGLGGALPQAMSYCLSFVILARGEGKIFMAIDVTSALINISLNIYCYSHWGLAGLGAAYLAWYVAYALMTWAVCGKRYRIGPSRQALGIVCGAFVIVAATIGLRFIGWWASLCVLPMCVALVYMARRKR